MVVIGESGRKTRSDGPCSVHRENLPERCDSLRVFNLVQRRLERYGGFQWRWRVLLVARTCQLELEPVIRAYLMEPKSHGQTRCDRGVIVPLERTSVPEKVNGEETRGLEDMDDPVRVLKCLRNSS